MGLGRITLLLILSGVSINPKCFANPVCDPLGMSWLTPFVIDARVGVTDPLELLKGVIICNDDSAFNLSRLLLLELDAKFESVKKDGVLAIATSGEGWMEHETN